MVYIRDMTAERTVRQSVSLPLTLARKIRNLAKSRRTSASRVLRDLVEQGIESQEREKERFFALADALVSAKDPDEQRRLKEELAKMTFGH